MKAELKKKWIDALLGKLEKTYKQGRDYLRDADSDCFCCLGVLVDIACSDRWIRTVSCGGVRETNYVVYDLNGTRPFRCYLPPDLKAQIGGDAVEDRLSKANDNGKSFAEIATMIEKLVPVDPE